MRLYLVWHGEAVSSETDPQRPLSEEGRGSVAKVARFMAANGVRVAKTFHSGKLRAEQTARILADAVALGAPFEEREGLRPNDPPQPIAQIISSLTEDTMIVGHLPFMSDLTSLLTTGSMSGEVAAFHTGAVTCLERYGNGWIILWHINPDLLAD